MLKEQVIQFLNLQLSDFTNFRYEIEEDKEFLYVNFNEVLGEQIEKEAAFKLIGDIVYYHSISFGWKAINKGSNNKFFWIDLVKK